MTITISKAALSWFPKLLHSTFCTQTFLFLSFTLAHSHIHCIFAYIVCHHHCTSGKWGKHTQPFPNMQCYYYYLAWFCLCFSFRFSIISVSHFSFLVSIELLWVFCDLCVNCVLVVVVVHLFIFLSANQMTYKF